MSGKFRNSDQFTIEVGKLRGRLWQIVREVTVEKFDRSRRYPDVYAASSFFVLFFTPTSFFSYFGKGDFFELFWF